jgi:myo-inositol-1(or 4)-monophosphatase
MAVKTAIINVMEAAARKAARSLLRDFGEVEHLQVSKKGPADFVSNADMKAERILRYELAKGRPGYGMVMEESGVEKGEDAHNNWIVDPLDGTTNFLHGLPHFAISIAHERDGEIVAGIVHEPVGDELFWAEKGKGAYLNGRRIRVSARARLSEALVATGIPFMGRDSHPRYLDSLAAMVPEIAGIRRFGAAALDLAYVAAGRYEGFWEFGLGPWDLAAGIVLVREAGGLVSQVDGRSNMLESGDILAANELLHGDIGNILRRALASGN